MTADFSPTGLRVLREVAQTGSFSAAARALGYTQSAVSRQVAALEAVAGRPLFHRSRTGVTITAAGARLLPRAIRVIDELDAAVREAAGEDVAIGPVRLGAFATAIAGLVPKALASLPPDLTVTLREGTTPALTRALRAGTLDLAVLASAPPFRPPDAASPALEVTTLAPIALDELPDGIKVVAVRGEPRETRRVMLARRPAPMSGPTRRVADALIAAARA